MSNIHLKRRAFFFDDPFFKSNWSDFDQVTYICTSTSILYSLPSLVDLDKLKGKVTRGFLWFQKFLTSFVENTTYTVSSCFYETLILRNLLKLSTRNSGFQRKCSESYRICDPQVFLKPPMMYSYNCTRT
jgi:hypothetical protein